MSDGRGEPTLGLRERKKLRTRATLINAALELCERQGFDNTTVDQIAAIADVSPRTFSRYFATKDAIALALVDEVLDRTAVELARQPADLNHFEAILRAYLAMAEASKRASAGELTAERVMCIVRIVLSSPALRQSSLEYRANAIERAIAERMGVSVHDRGPRLVSAVWGSVLMTALTDVAADMDGSAPTIDDVIARLQRTYNQFTGLTAGLPQPV
ncbi:TetR family transcriptional regulator [Mycobacterium sp. B14F4]|uniref:TetR family transcriptional regulator n=1 Tax=Mycobacterium sp. B14F4 TaxID=3153565 RepID=UPI00325C8B17